MANGTQLFEEVRSLLDRGEVPDDLSRQALWGALAVVYKQLEEFGGDYKQFRQDSISDRKNLNRAAKILTGVSAFFILVHLPDLASAADALWKLVLTLL